MKRDGGWKGEAFTSRSTPCSWEEQDGRDWLWRDLSLRGWHDSVPSGVFMGVGDCLPWEILCPLTPGIATLVALIILGTLGHSTL